MALDEQGRCCGTKPIRYKGGSWRSPPGSPMLYCCRCSRQYDPETGEQRENWAWVKDGDEFVRSQPARKPYW